jgi:L-seryl-tRNA(Ser) seleniumtransferase
MIDLLRKEILDGALDQTRSKQELLAMAERSLADHIAAGERSGLRRVINATGVIIHTNLGRAPLSEAARQTILAEASGYCTLEYDLETGKRGRRGRRAEELLIELTGAEDALIVNNCAAAAFFVLTAFAAGGEVVISRGELVEIGGDFRVPDVLAQSGSTLKEVGTTNRTKLSDYEKAIGPATKLLLRVHPSNYRMVGFTAAPALTELAELAHSRSLLLYEDIGSGALADLSGAGVKGEPVASASIEAGVDIVTFSGDKLLGGPQAGIIVGRGELIDRLRPHPLYRALRVDKLTYAALEATLVEYRRGTAAAEVPVQRMLAMTVDEIENRSTDLIDRFNTRTKDGPLQLDLIDGMSAVGGGAAPQFQPPTKLIRLSYDGVSADELEERLRRAVPPVIGRIVDDSVVLDLRTVAVSDEDEVLAALAAL